MASHSPSSQTAGCGGSLLALRLHGDERAPPARAMEGDLAPDRRENRVVLAHADIVAGVELGAALAQDDIAGKHDLAPEAFHAQAPAGAVASVAGTAARFLMGHRCCSLLGLGRFRRGGLL